MPFTARSAAEIRDGILSSWATRYRVRGQDLAIDRDSDAYAEADAIALVLEGLEIQAQANANKAQYQTGPNGEPLFVDPRKGTVTLGTVTDRAGQSVLLPPSPSAPSPRNPFTPRWRC